MPEEIHDVKAEWEKEAAEWARKYFSETLPNGEGFCERVMPIDQFPIEIGKRHYRLTSSDQFIHVYYARSREWVECQNDERRGTRDEYFCGAYKVYDLWRYIFIEDALVEIGPAGGTRVVPSSRVPSFLKEWLQGDRDPRTYFVISSQTRDQAMNER